MADWDDEDWEADSSAAPAPAPHVRPIGGGLGNWDDEDLSDDEETVDLKKPSAPMKPSKLRALALKKKEEEEMRLALERALAREKEMEEMSISERKMRQQQIVEEADLENAKDLFMTGGASQEGMKPPAEPTLDTFKPVSEEDFTKYATMIIDHCVELSNLNGPTKKKQTGLYVNFVKELMRGLTKDLSPEDSKDLSTFMGLLANEKRDQFKKSKGYKKKNNKKTSVKVDREDDMRGDAFDDFADDFM